MILHIYPFYSSLFTHLFKSLCTDKGCEVQQLFLYSAVANSCTFTTSCRCFVPPVTVSWSYREQSRKVCRTSQNQVVYSKYKLSITTNNHLVSLYFYFYCEISSATATATIDQLTCLSSGGAVSTLAPLPFLALWEHSFVVQECLASELLIPEVRIFDHIANLTAVSITSSTNNTVKSGETASQFRCKTSQTAYVC